MILTNKLEKFLKEKKPFVVYKEPNSKSAQGLFMNSDELVYTHDFLKDGFIFAPFDHKQSAIFFSKNKGSFITEKITKKTKAILNLKKADSTHELDKEKHLALVAKAIDEIKRGDFKKIVVSRKERISFNQPNIAALFQKLVVLYDDAFVYVWYHPKVGLWLGATPETLLKVKENEFTTMSLAGTKTAEKIGQIVWTKKEYEEQQMVTDFITDKLKNIINNLVIHKLETFKAGKLYHLKTKISGKIHDKKTLSKIIEALHPTPAICGLPRNLAKDFIVKNERYDREFYTGFLGEINLTEKNKTSLYVNLRCMQLKNDKAVIYVGGGVTKDSNPESEWQETVSKTKTMKSVLGE